MDTNLEHKWPRNGAGSSWTIFADQALHASGLNFPEGWVSLPIASKLAKSAVPNQEQRRNALIEILASGKLGRLGIDPLNQVSVDRSICFIRELPAKYALPKVSPDGEGDIFLVWEAPQPVLLTVEGNLIHAVINPGANDSLHLDDLEYIGGEIPIAVLEAIPTL